MKDCIFCRIIAGEIPCETVYENDEFKVILDAFPANKGHALILPKTHAANAFEINAELAERAFGLAVNVAKAMDGLDFAKGVNILQNNNGVAGQTVNHFHIHVIPRLEGDAVSMSWKPGGYEKGEASGFGERLAGRLKRP